MSTLRRWLFLLVSMVVLAACASAPPPPPPCPSDTTPKGGFTNDLTMAGGPATSDVLPVGADDPQRGNADALVTIVEFGDFQCPFCAKASKTLDRVVETYGPDKVRHVWKNQPLPFHPAARPAAELSVAILKVGGNDAFWKFHHAAYADGGLNEERLGELTQQSTLDRRALGSAIAEHGRAKVDADIALADRVGARGTPTFFINGVLVSGAQPYDVFVAAIDAELAQANAAITAGTPRAKIYQARVAANASRMRPAADDDDDGPAPAADERTVWAVPIDGSPFQGPADAPVTLVMFTDFQCPFCSRANASIAEVRRKYGSKLRLVHKHNPLPFHKEAEPASELAIEVLTRKGNEAFWQASDALFADQRDLGTERYAAIAAQLGLSKDVALAAIKSHKHQARIDRDQALAQDLEANGTPTFFINGRRLVGAQPPEKFNAIIDQELAKAEALIQSGTPAAKLYDQIVSIGKKSTFELERLDVPPPGKSNPSRGPANAPVVIQVWSDFQCPFCSRLAPTLAEVEKAYPGKVRVVFRHLPLPMHHDAALAAEAGAEAFREGGAPAFWKMHDAMFADQTRLDRQGLEETAKKIGLDPKRFGKALDDHVNKAIVEADQQVASDKGISATPTSIVGGYVVSGAQPLSMFKRVIQKVLDEQKAPPGAKPAQAAKR